MKKHYITFGQSHTHRVNGKTFDRDSIAVINIPDGDSGRDYAWDFFGAKWCFEYDQAAFDKYLKKDLVLFPRGLIEVN